MVPDEASVGDLQPRRQGERASLSREAASEAQKPAEEAQTQLQETFPVCGLQRRGVERLDSRPAGIPCLLLPGRVSVPAGGPPELHQPRYCTDTGELGEQQHSPGLLRSHGPESRFPALSGRVRAGDPKKLPGHGRGGLRMPLKSPHTLFFPILNFIYNKVKHIFWRSI